MDGRGVSSIGKMGYAKACMLQHNARMQRQEAQREMIVESLAKDRDMSAEITNEARAAQIRRNREYQALDAERELVMQSLAKQEQQESLRKQRELEKKQQELRNREETNALHEEKMKRWICATSEELRALRQKIELACVNATRAAQVKQAKLNSERARLSEHELARLEEEKLNEEEKAREAFEAAERLRKQEYHRFLEKQLSEREARKARELQEFMNEKAQVDMMLERIRKEDDEKVRQKLEAQRTTRQFIQEFLDQRRQIQQRELARIEEENKALEEYRRTQELRQQAKSERDNQASEDRKKLYEKLATTLEEKAKAVQEIEDLRVEASMYEAREAQRNRERELAERRIRQRLELIDAMAAAIQKRREERREKVEQEAEFRARMLAEMAENDRLEQLSNELRRRKQQEHRRAIDEFVVQRRAKEAEEKRLDEEDRRRAEDLENFRRRVVEQERLRLLSQNADRLGMAAESGAALPKGLIADKRDLDLFDIEFRKRFEAANDLE